MVTVQEIIINKEKIIEIEKDSSFAMNTFEISGGEKLEG